jgi:hypothetical protein
MSNDTQSGKVVTKEYYESKVPMVSINAKVPSELYTALMDYVHSHNESQSEFIRKAVTDRLEKKGINVEQYDLRVVRPKEYVFKE